MERESLRLGKQAGAGMFIAPNTSSLTTPRPKLKAPPAAVARLRWLRSLGAVGWQFSLNRVFDARHRAPFNEGVLR